MPAQVPLVCLSAAAKASDRRLAASTAANTPVIAPPTASIKVTISMIGMISPTR